MATILIVEDEGSVLELLKIILEPHQVVQAGDPVQAIELARLTRPDLILLDLNLHNHHDGLNVCRTLRGDPDPALARVPIVMLTGATSEADIRAALEAGANSYVSKPYSPSALLALVARILASGAGMGVFAFILDGLSG